MSFWLERKKNDYSSRIRNVTLLNFRHFVSITTLSVVKLGQQKCCVVPFVYICVILFIVIFQRKSSLILTYQVFSSFLMKHGIVVILNLLSLQLCSRIFPLIEFIQSRSLLPLKWIRFFFFFFGICLF